MRVVVSDNVPWVNSLNSSLHTYRMTRVQHISSTLRYLPSSPCSFIFLTLSTLQQTNTTHVLPGPPSSSPSHQYFAGISSLVQLDTTTGTLNFVPYTAGDFSANAQAAWNKVGRVVVPEGGVSGGSSSGSGTSSGSNGSGNGSGRVGSTGSSPNGTTTTDIDSNSGVSLGARTMIAPVATCLLAFSVFLALF